jgi:hypothetical protein
MLKGVTAEGGLRPLQKFNPFSKPEISGSGIKMCFGEGDKGDEVKQP